MADDFSRTWIDDLDDLDAEQLNDMEARMEARVGAVGGGIELGYQANGTAYATTSTAAGGVAVTGLTATVVVGARPIVVRVRADAWQAGAASGAILYLNEDGANNGAIAVRVATGYTPLFGERRLAPAAGSHTYAIYAKNASAGTINIAAGDGTGNNNAPMVIQVLEV